MFLGLLFTVMHILASIAGKPLIIKLPPK
ncbi:hypothetical protein THIOSC15_1260004 [uncultured Thiomicrorhabdus sp.]